MRQMSMDRLKFYGIDDLIDDIGPRDGSFTKRRESLDARERTLSKEEGSESKRSPTRKHHWWSCSFDSFEKIMLLHYARCRKCVPQGDERLSWRSRLLAAAKLE